MKEDTAQITVSWSHVVSIANNTFDRTGFQQVVATRGAHS